MSRKAILAQAIRRLVEQHHQAFAVELLGERAAKMSAADVQALVDAGIVSPKALGGVRVPGTDLDPFLFARMVSLVFDETEPEAQAGLRDWTLDQWVAAINPIASRETQQTVAELGGRVSVAFEATQPEPPDEPPDEEMFVDVPAWMTPVDRTMYTNALDRAGRYVRGLGNTAAERAEDVVAEVWEDDEIVEEVNEEQRQARLETIREQTAEAVRHRDPEQLARDLAFETEDWARDWRRIAHTEIQTTYNEARTVDGVNAYGDETRIARIPETHACEVCLSLFLDETGTPRIWSVEELLANGTNAGKPRAAWLPTLYPVHPYCRCDTVIVPPGLRVDRYGAMETEDE